MAKTRTIQTAFTSGVLSPLLKGRIDIGQYTQGLEIGRNWVLLPQGGIKRRPGTQFIDKALPLLTRNTTTPTMPEGGTGANINDDNDSTTTTTTTNVSTINPYVIAKYDLGSSTFIEVVDIRGIFLTVSGTTSDLEVQWSDDDITFFAAVGVPLVGTSAQDFRLRVNRTARYWRLARIGSADLTTNRFTLAEFNLHELQAALSEAKLKDFSITSESHFLIAITDGNLRIYRKSTNTRVADVKVPYLSSEVLNIRAVQSESVMLLFHEDHDPQRLINLGTDTDWSIDEPVFSNIPQFDYNDASSPTPVNDVQVMTFVAFVAGDTFQIDVEGVLSKNITFAGDTTAAEQSSTAFNIQKNLQEMPTFGETGVAVVRTGALAYTITVSGESTKAFELYSAFPTSGTATKTITFVHSATGSPRAEDVWGTTRGFPRTACFYEGRLILGGAKSKRQSIFMSKSGSVFDFDLGEGDDDEGIFITISSRRLNDVVDVFPGRNLQIFTSGSEFTINTVPITPQTVGITPQTSHGSQFLEAKEIDGATIFSDRNGKSIKEYLFSFQENAYITNDISVISPELIKAPTDVAILGGTASDDANWVFIVNNDGSATVLNTLRAQDINGFTEWTTSGFITNVSVVDDELYMVNKRTVGGVESHFIERWSFDFLLDCSKKVTNVVPMDAVSGYLHLANEPVRIVGDMNVLTNQTVSSTGVITFAEGEDVHVNIEAGLPFIPELKQMPVNTNVGSGFNATRLKKLIRMNMRVKDTFGLEVDGVPLPNRNFDVAADSPLDAPPTQRTGIYGDVLVDIGWQRDDMPLITVPDPTPTTILTIEYEVESS